VYDAVLVKSVKDMGLSPISSRKHEVVEPDVYEAVLLKKGNVNILGESSSDSPPESNAKYRSGKSSSRSRGSSPQKVDSKIVICGVSKDEVSSTKEGQEDEIHLPEKQGEGVNEVNEDAPSPTLAAAASEEADDDDEHPNVGRLIDMLDLDPEKAATSTTPQKHGHKHHHHKQKPKGLRIGDDDDSSFDSSDFSEDDEGFGSPLPNGKLRDSVVIRSRSAERDSIVSPKLAPSPSFNEAAMNRKDSKAAEVAPKLSYVNTGRNPITNDAQNHSYLLPAKRNMSITRFINI
jgi:hypothetical protein